jgi:AcrR family transcriptional regulator
VITRPNLLAAESLPPQPRQRRSLDKRERLKAAALALFGDRGFERTSVNDIAARAKLAVGGFYLHFRSKRQILIVLMDDLLQRLERIEFRPAAAGDRRAILRAMLGHAFSLDLHYLGAYRAWQEAALADPELARRQSRIHRWTTTRVRAVFERLQLLPGARRGVDIASLARVMDAFFWSLLAQAHGMPRRQLDAWLDAATHLIYHALFEDDRSTRPPARRRVTRS